MKESEILKENFKRLSDCSKYSWFCDEVDKCERLKKQLETIRKKTARDILKILHEIGGCDATKEWDKGFDAAINTAYDEIKKRYGVGVDE